MRKRKKLTKRQKQWKRVKKMINKNIFKKTKKKAEELKFKKMF